MFYDLKVCISKAKFETKSQNNLITRSSITRSNVVLFHLHLGSGSYKKQKAYFSAYEISVAVPKYSFSRINGVAQRKLAPPSLAVMSLFCPIKSRKSLCILFFYALLHENIACTTYQRNATQRNA